MASTIKVALAGAGAFGLKHLNAIRLIDGVEAISLVGRNSKRVARDFFSRGIHESAET
jgi:2-hydroxy-4-carboxymuconate semialdehyde hemiacetal dehydrogenase